MNATHCDVMVGEQINRDIVHQHVSTDRLPTETITNVTIFDYDDTILPSTWLTRIFSQTDSLSTEMLHQLKKVDVTASALLREALKRSTVIIVTNAEEGWVEHSSSVFLPSVFNLLRFVTICSARARYGSLYPQESTKWKQLTFSEEFDQIRNRRNGVLSLLSIGDSLHEREAVFSYGALNSNVIAKSIKMIDIPSPSQLATQQELIGKALPSMIASSEKLDLKLSVQASP